MMMLDDWLRPLSSMLALFTLQFSLLVALVLALRAALGRWLTPRWRCALWSIVLLRLLWPALPDRLWAWRVTPSESPRSILPLNQETMAPAATPAPAASLPPVAPTPPLSDAPPASRWPSTPTLLVSAWLVGLLVCLGRAVLTQWRLRRLLLDLPPLSNPVICRELDGLSARLRVRTPRVVMCGPHQSPAVAGLLRPTLIVPTNLSAQLTPAQLRLVLTHELLHIRRFDVLWRWTAALAVAIQWFNPLAWLGRARFLVDCELATDAGVLRRSGEPRHAYGETLLTIAGWTRLQPPAGAVAMLGRPSVVVRIHALLQPARFSLLAGVTAVTIAGCTLLPQQSVTPANIRPLEVRSYDVRDLLITASNYDGEPAPVLPATQPSAGVRLGVADDRPWLSEHTAAVQKLINLVQDGVDRPSWNLRGGRGTVKELGGALIVTQTARNQAAVEQLLLGLRKEHNVQISIETRFLRGRHIAAEARALLDSQRSDSDAAVLSDDQAARLIAAAQDARWNDTTLTAPRLMTFNGQRAFVIVDTSTAYVSDLTVAADESGAETYQPIIRTVESGVKVDCQATMSADRQYLTMTVRPEQSNLLSLKTQPFWESESGQRQRASLRRPPTSQPFVQVPTREICTTSMTVSLPDRSVLMTLLQPVVTPAETQTAQPDPVVVLIKPMIADGTTAHPYPPSASIEPTTR